MKKPTFLFLIHILLISCSNNSTSKIQEDASSFHNNFVKLLHEEKDISNSLFFKGLKQELKIDSVMDRSFFPIIYKVYNEDTVYTTAITRCHEFRLLSHETNFSNCKTIYERELEGCLSDFSFFSYYPLGFKLFSGDSITMNLLTTEELDENIEVTYHRDKENSLNIDEFLSEKEVLLEDLYGTKLLFSIDSVVYVDKIPFIKASQGNRSFDLDLEYLLKIVKGYLFPIKGYVNGEMEEVFYFRDEGD